jgi:hypothetical protein
MRHIRAGTGIGGGEANAGVRQKEITASFGRKMEREADAALPPRRLWLSLQLQLLARPAPSDSPEPPPGEARYAAHATAAPRLARLPTWPSSRESWMIWKV